MILKACLKNSDAVNMEEVVFKVTSQESNCGEIVDFVTVRDVLECGRRLKNVQCLFVTKTETVVILPVGFYSGK